MSSFALLTWLVRSLRLPLVTSYATTGETPPIAPTQSLVLGLGEQKDTKLSMLQVLKSRHTGMPKKLKVTNEKKNLNRLAGEFLVASRLTQRGYMVALQWGTTIGYDILVFDKDGNVAYVEVKATASHPRKWLLQKKYANLSGKRGRFICCVDLTPQDREPDIFVFPEAVVVEGLRYFYSGRFSESPSYVLPLNSRPRGYTGDTSRPTVGEHVEQEKFLGWFEVLGVNAITQ